VLGLITLFVRPRRVTKLAAILKPATLLRLHKALVDRKYRRLFSSAGTRRKPGPKGPTEEIVAAILEMKFHNPRFGNQRIAEQISHAFAVQIDKDVVRRVLAKRYGSNLPGASGPSWLTFFAQAKDSLFSVDLFRCESILLRSHWVLVVIDVCTRRIVGFGIGGEYVDGPAVCRTLSFGNSHPTGAARDLGSNAFLLRRFLVTFPITSIGACFSAAGFLGDFAMMAKSTPPFVGLCGTVTATFNGSGPVSPRAI